MKIITEESRDTAISLFEEAYTERLEELQGETEIKIPRNGIDDAAREWWESTVRTGCLPLTENHCSKAGRDTASEEVPNLIAYLSD
jgi:hypothetical protein